MMKLCSDAKKLIRLLHESGYKAYAVGGCVRDDLLGRPCGDIDITTSATPRETEAVLEKNGVAYYETGLKHGTVTAVIHKVGYEITTFRCDGDYLDNRHPREVAFVSDVRLDLARRDFTMNALAYNDEEGFIDAYGGLQDIKHRVIRAVGNPDTRFQEDGLRIMRALRFAAVLGFTVEENTKRAVFENKELLLNISAERLLVELVKLLTGDFAEEVLLEYKEVLAVIIPEMAPCFGCEQHSKWHLYDVYTHIVKTVAVTPKKDFLRLAALFHDIAKPECKTTDENGTDHFFTHPEKSADYAEKIMTRFKASNDLKNKVVTLVRYHDKHITRKPSNIKKWLRLLGEDFIFDFIDLKIADMQTHNLDNALPELEELRYVRGLTQQIIDSGEPYRISDLKLNGRDLVDIGFTGKEIQIELEKLIHEVSGNPDCNTREKLLHRAAGDYKRLTEDA